MFGLFKKKKISGDIGAYGLQDWWFENFSQADREWMREAYTPIAPGVYPLTDGNGLCLDSHPFRYLSGVSAWFNKDGYQHCAIAFLKKAMEFYDDNMPVLDRHFGLAEHCKVYYRWREEIPGALEAAIIACETCISFHKEAAKELYKEFNTVPGHACFRQLRIIEEKRQNYARAIQLCMMAKEGGWADDWDKHIARIQKKMAS